MKDISELIIPNDKNPRFFLNFDKTNLIIEPMNENSIENNSVYSTIPPNKYSIEKPK